MKYHLEFGLGTIISNIKSKETAQKLAEMYYLRGVVYVAVKDEEQNIICEYEN